jgi:hypothetical protein
MVYPHEEKFSERQLWKEILEKRERKIKMIVNKPQFDTNEIKPGQAYWLTKQKYNGFYEINTPCVVVSVKPLSIIVAYYNEKNNSMDHVTISIDNIVKETFKLEKMVIEGKK